MSGGRPKGYPKTGGRQKGTLNKFSREHLIEILEKNNIDPTQKLIELLPKLKEHQQAGIFLEWQRTLSRSPDGDLGDDERTPKNSTPSTKSSTDELLKRVLRDTHNANRSGKTAGSR